MSQPKPKESLHGEKCPICDQGHLQLIRSNHEVSHPDEPVMTVPDVWIEQCDQCSEQFFPSETMRHIEEFIAEQAEQLSSDELERIREALGVDQTEMSEILGLGEKTFHRWEKGSQYPSRSMCYYIRVLAHFPESFEWLREKGWRRSNRVAAVVAALTYAEQFPDLAGTLGNQRGRVTTGRLGLNPARGLSRVAFTLK
ncbi:MAG: type II TA system antitoxin MqsA family protein [Verrucomicrobiota bacterium]